MKIRVLSILFLCFSLVSLPVSGCSNGITEPQETVFNFLDQFLSGDPQLLSDSFSYIHHTQNKEFAKEFGEKLKKRLAGKKTADGGYITKTFLIAENKSKPQTATVSSQYLRIPDLKVFCEVELRKVNDRWLILDQSAIALLSDTLYLNMKQNPQTPHAGTWHEAEIQVHTNFTEHWDQILQN